MDDLRISAEATPTREDIAILEAGLTAHTLPIIGVPGFKPLAVFLRDSAGRIVAGAYGRTNWNWLHISTLWVAEAERGKGLGRTGGRPAGPALLYY
jgi:hypothetical protein